MKTTEFNFKNFFLTILCLLAFNFLEAQQWNTGSNLLWASPTSSKVAIGYSYSSVNYRLVVGGGSSLNGIYAYANGSGKRAIYGINYSSTGHAGYFRGNVYSTGNIEAAINKRIRVGNNTSRISMSASTCCPGAFVDTKGGPLQFRTEGVNWRSGLTVQSNGTVVIAGDAIYDGSITNTNGHKLSVNGGIWAEEVEIISNVPASDYVFYDEYELMPLPELERFVNKNHHLPEVPSAEEFKENGYKIGDMDDLLLRKVEELSLYVIDADKEIKNLKAEKELLMDKFFELEARLAKLENK